jgi:hypothetical protein
MASRTRPEGSLEEVGVSLLNRVCRIRIIIIPMRWGGKFSSEFPGVLIAVVQDDIAQDPPSIINMPKLEKQFRNNRRYPTLLSVRTQTQQSRYVFDASDFLLKLYTRLISMAYPCRTQASKTITNAISNLEELGRKLLDEELGARLNPQLDRRE